MPEFSLDDLSLLQLAALAEDFAWGEINLNDEQRERLRLKLIHRFDQVELLNRLPVKPTRQI